MLITNNNIYKRFYSKFLFLEPNVFDKDEVSFICTEKRDNKLVGYPKPLYFCLLKTEMTLLLSYSPLIKNKAEKILSVIDNTMSIETLKEISSEILGQQLNHNIKFKYSSIVNCDSSKVVKLTADNYIDYEHFFKKAHPNVTIETKKDNWLYKYFIELTTKELSFGIVKDNQLVSVTDSPDIPFMDNELAMLGINTLPEYRNKGYAKSVLSAMIKSILSQNKLPLWSCTFDNSISEKLAISLGFEKFGEMLSL